MTALPENRKVCQIDSHARAEEIAGWLRQGIQAGRINDMLRETDPEHRDFAAAVMSRHRTGCLGLVKLAKGRGPRSEVTEEDIKKVEEEGEITAEMVKDLSLKSFYVRLKKNPADVGMKELVSVIGALSRAGAGGKTGKGALEEAMSNLDDD